MPVRLTPLELARLALLVLIAAFLAYLIWLLAGLGRQSPPPPAPPEPPPSGEAGEEPSRPRSTVEAMDFMRRRAGKPALRIQCKGMTAYEDGATLLEEPVITFPPEEEGGETWTATGRRAVLRDKPQRMRLEGEARIVSSEDSRLETDVLDYDEEKDEVRSEGPVRLFRAGARIDSDALVHKPGRGETWLEGNVRGVLEPGSGGMGGEFRSDSAFHSSAAHTALLQGRVRGRFGAFHLEAPILEILLDEDGSVTGGVARGRASITSEAGREIRGDRILFQVEGEELRRVEAVGDAEAVLPGEEDEPLMVRGASVLILLEPGAVPREMIAEGGEQGEVVVTGLPGARGATARSRRLESALGEEGAARTARFLGRVRLEREGVVATGDEALWTGNGSLVLTGSPGIRSPRGDAFGETVVVAEDGSVVVEGRVHSVMDPGSSPDGSRQVPLFQEGAGSIYIASDRLELAPDGSRLIYTGSPVQAKQGDSSLLARSLTIYEGEDRVEAEGEVHSRVRLARGEADGPSEGPVDPHRLTDARSRTLVYQDDVITYGGGSVLEQGNNRLHGETITIYLQQSGEGGGSSRVERIVADQDAEAHMGERHAWGDRIVYVASEQIVRVFGSAAPARAEDRSRSVSGRGKTLTLNLDSGTLKVEADPHGRTVSGFRAREARTEGGGEQGETDSGTPDRSTGEDLPEPEGR